MSAAESLPVNHWPDNACAKAFWGQRELPPYRKLLKHTMAWLEPKPGQRWLDLGCGGGQLTRGLWEKSQGKLAEIVALDCAAANATAFQKLRATMTPPATEQQVRFLCADFSHGLASYAKNSFDGATSGLALHYAESWDASKRTWTTAAYDRLLSEVSRVLRPGGSFVFSVNCPNPNFVRVAFSAVTGFFVSRNPFMYLVNAARMWKYGRWLRAQARMGRFHFLNIEKVQAKLEAVGFERVEHRLSHARQAYLIRCRKS